MISELEEENQALLVEYDRLRTSKAQTTNDSRAGRGQELSPASSGGEARSDDGELIGILT